MILPFIRLKKQFLLEIYWNHIRTMGVAKAAF